MPMPPPLWSGIAGIRGKWHMSTAREGVRAAGPPFSASRHLSTGASSLNMDDPVWHLTVKMLVRAGRRPRRARPRWAWRPVWPSYNRRRRAARSEQTRATMWRASFRVGAEGPLDLESTNGRPGGLEVDTTREMAKLTPTSALWLIGHSAGRDGWGDVEYLAAKGECVSWMTAGRLEGIPTRSI